MSSTGSCIFSKMQHEDETEEDGSSCIPFGGTEMESDPVRQRDILSAFIQTDAVTRSTKKEWAVFGSSRNKE